jgi:CRP-like cAMP-binding protein
MTIDALVAPLLKIALFQGLRPLQITEIARCAERIVFRPGQSIVEVDQAGDAAYVIVSGDVARTKGPEVGPEPELVPVGSLIGEMAMLVETEYSSTVVAQSSVRALKITRNAMYTQMADDSALAEHLVAKISSRLKGLVVELRRIDQGLASDDGAEHAELTEPHEAAARSSVSALEQFRPGRETQH